MAGCRTSVLLVCSLALFISEAGCFINLCRPVTYTQSVARARASKLTKYANNGPEDEKKLEDDFLEDTERKEKKVKMFGAWLDDTVAGHNTLSVVEDEITDEVYQKILRTSNFDKSEARSKLETFLQRRKKANEFFRNGVKSMKSGRYRDAVDSFSQAIFTVPEGVQSRDGGQYSIWLAQALDANGQKGKALMTIRACKAHNDRDVQRVAAGVEFIMLAPKLQTTAESFTWIDYNKIEDIKDGGRKTLYAPVKKLPEKYSLEWYMLQKPKRTARADDSADAGAALAASATILAGLAIYAMYVTPGGPLPGS